MNAFGERLKDFRVAVGWSQPQLAEKSGVPVGTIRDYEQGRRAPLLETAAKLAMTLKQPLETFLQGSIDTGNQDGDEADHPAEPARPRGRPRKEASAPPEDKPARVKPAPKKGKNKK